MTIQPGFMISVNMLATVSHLILIIQFVNF